VVATTGVGGVITVKGGDLPDMAIDTAFFKGDGCAADSFTDGLISSRAL